MSTHPNTRPQLGPLALLERAATRTIETPEGCWEFQGALSEGYGAIGHKKNVWRLHRLAYIAMVDEVPDGLQLDHLCRNRACWNPYHLEPVTPRVNILRGQGPTALAYAAGECLRGHSMRDPKNVYETTGGHRQCAVCARESARRRRSSR